MIALFALGCGAPASGTFVGNPTMSARLADNPVQRAAGGRLEAIELHFVDTDDSLTALGPTTFTFEGPEAEESIRVPTATTAACSWWSTRSRCGSRRTAPSPR